MPDSAASPVSEALLRSYIEDALRPVPISRRLVWTMLAVAGVAGMCWSTRDDPRLSEEVVAIFALHELGHLLAARLLRLKRRSGVWIRCGGSPREPFQGWRSAVIALAGPLPGLIVAVILMAGFIRGRVGVEWAEGAYVGALFNGLNLLPFYPLDGGRFLHGLFFGRHPWTEVAFRLVATLGLAIGAILSGQLWLLLFAVFPLIALRSSFAVGLQAQALRARRRGVEVTDAEIGEAVAKAFADERRPRMLARRALAIRSLTSRQPESAAMILPLGLAYALGGTGAIVIVSFPSLLG